MSNAKPSARRTPNPAAMAPAASSGAGHPHYWASAVFSVVLFALCGAGRADVAFIAFIHLNLLLLFWWGRRFERSPLASVERDRARFAMWALSATLLTAFTWKMTSMIPPSYTIVAWVMDATAVFGFAYHLLALRR
ncbi:unnamed protein product [Urochloa humidicola]